MSLLNNLINKFQQLFSGSAAPSPNSGRAIQARQQLFTAILEACEDGVITADEMSDVRTLQAKLGMSDAELNSIKIQVLQNLIAKVMEDNIVTEEEMDFIEQIEIDLQLGVADSLKIKTDIEKVRAMYKQSKSGTTELDDDYDSYDNYDDYDDEYQDAEYDDDREDEIGAAQATAMATAVGAGAILAYQMNQDSDLEDDPTEPEEEIDQEEIDQETTEEPLHEDEIETFSDES